MFNLSNESHFTLTVGGLENTGLQVLAFEGKEVISKPYQFEVTLVNKNIRFDITKLLSRSAYLAFTPDRKSGVHGVIMSVQRGAIGHDYAEYRVILAPRFSHLEKRTNQRIFQHKTVPQIISQTLNEYGIVEGAQHEFRVKEEYPERDYCVQYDETDAHFIQRLCQEEGIFYYFQHDENNHFMIFGDSNPVFTTLQNAIRYASGTGFVADDPVIKAFNVNLTSKTKRATWRDYNYTNTKIPEGQAEGAQSAKANGATEPDVEFYDYPGRFMDNARGKQLAQIEIERLRTEQVLAQGYSDVPTLHIGHYFILEGHPSLDATDPWLINTIVHQGKQPQVTEALGGEHNAHLARAFSSDLTVSFPEGDFHQGYRNTFTATPKDVPWRPPLDYPKARIYGSQTAKVVGPKGEEIYCDKYGSVKVQFPWDREGQFDENSSCWVRVGSSWAHKGYGTFTIPRINMEVLITYLEGDPDQPVITGCINNGVNTQAESMPANKTKTGFKTNSSPGGGGSNEFTLEDKKGEELVFIHAQKDMTSVIENNETMRVGVNRVKTIGQDEVATMGRNRLRVVKENDTLKVGVNKNDHIADTYYVGVGTHLKLECGKTVVELHANGKLNITCEEFNITAKQTGKINTIESVLDLNMVGKAAALDAVGVDNQTIKKDVDSHFGGGSGGQEGSTVEQDQQTANIHQSQLNEAGVTESSSKPPANSNTLPPTANLLPATIPATVADAPKEVNLSSMQGAFDQLWGNSFPGGKSQEFGGTFVKDTTTGEYSIINTKGGTTGSFAPDLNVPTGKEVAGIFHTHPYDATEGGYTGVSLSGGDAGYLINQKHSIMVAQSGTDQFMYMRTAATPTSIDAIKLNNDQNTRMGELIATGKSFSEASKQAAQETAKMQGLAYYEGSGGKFTLVSP
ncbi:type VI secretion system tip protein VgrG [Entomomonas moraniae]|uniref:Type VI secretion system tip protein VgrG n=1 Tax=Entomomonas moraniae TaxID=2213226 RepID=A0A3Q9JH54_9GAMM|nr:type VI secretion system tip protein TssI/VgrG [Entomomonas moraniae]AZS49445.1 type VI secretion system tip protein VgrG [Entomomonas moraniae]